MSFLDGVLSQGITNRASSLVGPNVCSAIIDNTGNSWNAFIFL
jgi:hypothetical protein